MTGQARTRCAGQGAGLIAAQQAAKGIGRIRLTRVADASAKSLEPAIAAAIEIGSQVRTDDWKGYSGLNRPGPSGRMAARSRCLDASLTVRCRSTPVPAIS